jgi:hypothetical protein
VTHSIPVFLKKKPSTKKNCFLQTAQNHVITITPRSKRGLAFLQHKIRPMSVVAPWRRKGHNITFINAKVTAWQRQQQLDGGGGVLMLKQYSLH